MTLYMTNDGMFGWQITNTSTVKWFNSEYQARLYGLIQFDYNVEDDYEVSLYNQEFSIALDIMREKRHNKAEFGMLGKFMYTVDEKEWD